MSDPKVADAKLAQYLNEAYAKERELETALEAHIQMTTRAPYKKRLRQHLTETRDHGRQVERRIKALTGSGPGAVEKIAGQALGQAKSLAKGPLHLVRGTSEPEKMLKNAKTEYWNEHEEIATYTAIEALADEVGDSETAKVARSIRRDEERMASFLERQIPTLTKAVAREEIPASERRTSGRRSRRRTSTSTRRRASSNGGRSRRSASSSRRSGSRRRRTTGSRS
jgi:ferritin-like metal-binding protein YciE